MNSKLAGNCKAGAAKARVRGTLVDHLARVQAFTLYHAVQDDIALNVALKRLLGIVTQFALAAAKLSHLDDRGIGRRWNLRMGRNGRFGWRCVGLRLRRHADQKGSSKRDGGSDGFHGKTLAPAGLQI